MAKREKLSLKELLEQALVKGEYKPYKVPDNWVWTKLDSYIKLATDFVANGSFASLKESVAYFKEENYALMVKTQDFANDFTTSLSFTDKKGYDFLAKSSLTGGELILSNIGASIGKVFRVPHFKRPMTLAPNTIMLKCYEDLDYAYLYYLFLSPIGNKLLNSISSGSATPKFNKTELKMLPIPIAPRAEQKRIVAIIESLFEKLDRAKELAKNALDSFGNRKSAILHKAFTGELTRKWREENGVDLEKDWEEKELGELIKDGPQNGLYKPQTAYGSGVLIIRIDSFYDGKVNPWNTLKNLKIEKNEIDLYGLKNNDILINRVNSIQYLGKSALVRNLEEICVFESNVMRITLKQDANPEYVIRYLNSDKGLSELRKNAKHAVNQASINQKDVKNALISIPMIKEQQEIVRILDNLLENEQKGKALCDVIGKIDHMKKSILARAFRGELGTNQLEEESALELLKEVLKEKS